MAEMRNMLVSHIHEDDAGLVDFRDLLRRNGMEVRDYSITSDKVNNAKSPDYIKSSILGPRIDACSTLVVYLTPKTKDSDWVNWDSHVQAQDPRAGGGWRLDGRNGKCERRGPPGRALSLCHEGNGGSFDPLLSRLPQLAAKTRITR